MRCLALAAALAAGGANAQSADAIRLANELGAMLAAEEACGLSYDHAAIGAWVETRVDAADMSFAPTLATMTTGAAFALKGMSASHRAAHCAQTRRAAMAAGFIAAE